MSYAKRTSSEVFVRFMAVVEGVGKIAPPQELVYLDAELADRAGRAGRKRAMKQEYQKRETWKSGAFGPAKTMVIGCIAEAAVYQYMRDTSARPHAVRWDEGFIEFGGDAGVDVWIGGTGVDVKGSARPSSKNLIRYDHYFRERRSVPHSAVFACLGHGIEDQIAANGDIETDTVAVLVRGWIKWQRIQDCEVERSTRSGASWSNFVIDDSDLLPMRELVLLAETRAALC